ncbi:formate/nitrite transporter family protein [Brucella pseudogrignonensis]|uniref:formate/nitrite transporter family protein n=1 Tax=Brucella pseudogrignonensis TaxID=419475 RepID=UPI000CFD0CA3|nr:formate/nitrite transporter family protein [Brucella pseudogrignonensis]MQP40408.1 formate transporter [Ochrobactrum sp. MYb237]PQZ39486.1 formate transporter [Brucella pseudogrignonensis]PRA41011.1 formate transporter [Brucella pseudogrignonensis]PRA69837.1 formate transporter [Brucella pseudogrignonensis]
MAENTSAEQTAETLKETLPSKSAAIHELIRRHGEKELGREVLALLWSAIAAGISMSFSMMARGILEANLPASEISFLISSAGYTVGFIIVIIANQQLFTENTITPVLPFMDRPSARNLWRVGRLWGIVLTGNLIGGGIAASAFAILPIFSDDTLRAFVAMGHHLMENSAAEMFGKAIISGWLIATLVWMLHSTKASQFAIIFLVTYLIAIGDFTHIIVGSIEVMFLLLMGEVSISDAIMQFGIPTLFGNVFGGTFIFALISHAQIKADE